MSNAEVRARHLQSLLATLEELPAEDARAVREAIPPGTLDAVTRASSLTWLPLSVDLDFVHAIDRTLGRARAREVYRRQLARGFETPLFGPFVQGALRVMGPDPARTLTRVPSGMGLVLRGLGDWAVESTGEREAHLTVSGLPDGLDDDRAFLESMAGGFLAVLDVLGHVGQAEVVDAPPGSGRWRLTWR